MQCNVTDFNISWYGTWVLYDMFYHNGLIYHFICRSAVSIEEYLSRVNMAHMVKLG